MPGTIENSWKQPGSASNSQVSGEMAGKARTARKFKKQTGKAVNSQGQ